jgi:hypothetical protein
MYLAFRQFAVMIVDLCVHAPTEGMSDPIFVIKQICPTVRGEDGHDEG